MSMLISAFEIFYVPLDDGVEWYATCNNCPWGFGPQENPMAAARECFAHWRVVHPTMSVAAASR